MKKWHQQIRPWLTKSFALPSDVLLELPRITVIGQLHVYIENHKGLASYSDTELKLKANKGYIRITGSAFVLKLMLPEEILLEGTIRDITFIPDGGEGYETKK
ncbi:MULTISPECIES: sporulation protein YqfC [Bacillota]|uniref:Sporulation protein YqfC n=1 Tax=Virgibacillus pantothenticus TaxID=1473 RepID=A0A0L0QQR1_VIRPA|nr:MULTISPECIES: sporulation protein YqfC [Bacillota]NBJ68559.1 sporulation protein YqfC [Roseburia sp. 1XD42-34]API90574.1 sporulation protein YqfC [Virgibacillus sp. 6R]KNE20528.1 sporulation protein YqfC [Virgibacillus pantothenticus]MBS7429687.1 sporulation protein YqfC [Virgibacillus sp. 19R1-5]MBU8565562.1 sporulation protein YqfC [Virgibacillus pantothenticus]